MTKQQGSILMPIITSSWTWDGLGNALFNPKLQGVDANINAVKQRLSII